MTAAEHTCNPIDRLPVFVATALLSGLGALMYEISSEYSYMVGKTYSFGEGRQGDMMAAFFTGYSLIAVSMVFWVRKVDWRLISALSTLAGLLGFALTAVSGDYYLIMACMFIAGTGLGAGYALSLTIFGDSSNPARAFGIKFFFDVMPGFLFNLLLPPLFDKHGLPGVAGSIVLYCVVVLIASALLPQRGSKHPSALAGRVSLKEDGLTLVACFSAFILVLGLMALWNFLAQIGTMKGFSMTALGPMLAIGSGLNAVGALFAVWLGNRFGRVAPVAVTIAINIVMLLVIDASKGFVGFAIGSLVFCFTNNYTTAYTIALISDIDVHGRLMPFVTACFAAGAIFGPMFAGHLLESQGLSVMLILPALCWVAAWSSFGWCHHTALKRKVFAHDAHAPVVGQDTHP
jgi:predicted MFS family arabinose efflux permease